MIHMTYTHRTTAYVDTVDGDGLVDDGTRFTAGAYPSLSAIIDVLPCRVRTLYLCGPAPETDGSTSLWFTEPLIGWTCAHADLDDALPMLSLSHVACTDGKPHALDVRRMAAWFGDDADNVRPDDACTTMGQLERDVMEAFDSGAKLLGTPGMTGRDLWARTVRDDYAPIDESLQQLIRGTSGQGRIELLTVPERETLPAVYVYDGRWMYAALCRHMPVGPARLEESSVYEPFLPARYHIAVTVPAGWRHVGLLPKRVQDSRDDSKRWTWPAAPGECFETWVDGVELDIAVRCGWRVDVKERIVFERGNPLERWVTKLQGMRARYDAGSARADRMCRAAVRNMVLHTIGGFFRAFDAFPVLIYPDQAQRYSGREFVGDVRRLDSGAIAAKVRRPLSKRNATFQHPEWSAHIYARARARLLSFNQRRGGDVIGQQGMLHMDRADVLYCHTDSLWTSCRLDWPDVGANGHFRLKETLQGRVKAPHSEEDMRRLRAAMRRAH